MRYVSLVCYLLGLVAAAVNADDVPFYKVQVTVTPQLHQLQAVAVIEHPRENAFLLNQQLQVSSIVADGKPVNFSVEKVVEPYRTENKYQWPDNGKVAQLTVTYGGELPADEGSSITEHLVELQVAGTWFPSSSSGIYDFRYSLTATMPQTFKAIANAPLLQQTIIGDQQQWVWRSDTPSFDITLLAAPNFKQYQDASGLFAIWYVNMPPIAVQQLASAYVKAARAVVAEFGVIPHQMTPTIVLLDRLGSGAYSRLPLIISGEPFTREMLAGNNTYFLGVDGVMLEIYGFAHEASHFWWSITNFTTNDGWIDEAVAEYIGLRTMRQFSKVDADKMLAAYLTRAVDSKHSGAIATVGRKSPFRYLNWYERGSLMFFQAESRFGQDKIDILLHTFYEKFKDTKAATTGEFLALAQQQLGDEGYTFFENALTQEDWHP